MVRVGAPARHIWFPVNFFRHGIYVNCATQRDGTPFEDLLERQDVVLHLVGGVHAGEHHPKLIERFERIDLGGFGGRATPEAGHSLFDLMEPFMRRNRDERRGSLHADLRSGDG